MRPFGTAHKLEQRRMLAVRLLADGISAADVARRTQVDPRSVRRWRTAARKDGEGGVAAKPAGRRPRRLTQGDLAWLRWILMDGPQAFGVQAEPWSCAEVAGLIQRQFGVHYHRAHVNRILHSLGVIPPKRCR